MRVAWKSSVEMNGGIRIKKGFSGNDLLLHAVTHVLPSALASLTTGFGMGPGMTSSHLSPKNPCLTGLGRWVHHLAVQKPLGSEYTAY